MKKEMLINVLQPEECRIAILEDGLLEELYVERTSQESYVGNVYKGRIVNIEPSIQAAFVDFGIGRNGFLHVSDVDPAYYKHLNGQGRGQRREPRRHQQGRDAAPRPQREEGFGEFHQEPPPRRIEMQPPPLLPVAAYAPDYDDFGPPPPPERARRHGPPRGTSDDDYDPEALLAGDPYAGLLHELGGQPPRDPNREKPGASDDPQQRHRGGRGRRGPNRDEPRREEPRREEPIQLFPPPLPPMPREPERKSEPNVEPAKPDEGFGSGIDLWGDDMPPPFVRGADRRTEDDDEDFDAEPRGGGHRDSDEDDDDEAETAVGVQRGPRRGGPPRRRGRDGDGVPKPNIQDIFKRGQEVLVQVIKEGIGTKGPTLSTYISIAGRYLVLMPGLSRIGVSRKIDDEEQRRRLKDILTELNPPNGLGFIIRTAGTDRNKKELQNDLAYLLRIWQVVVKRIKQQKGPCPIYQESDMITRTIRDTFTPDVDAIWIDENQAYTHAHEFLHGVMPRYANRLKFYDSTEPLFHKYGIENEIAKIQQKKLPLPHGGSIVIEQTEALVAIDVNSGSYRAEGNAEDTAFQINLQAAKEIARQLRLRDLGGVIVNDFIDMKDDKHRRGVEKALRDAVKRDRARTKVLRISQFGLIEMTRQRIRPSLKRSVFQDCGYCQSNGHVKTTESMAIEVMRLIQLAAFREPVRRIDVRVCATVADYLVNRRRRDLARLEEQVGLQVLITGLREVSPEKLEYVCFDAQNNEVPLNPVEHPPRPHNGNPGGHRGGRGRR